jgi:hypothetical protein
LPLNCTLTRKQGAGVLFVVGKSEENSAGSGASVREISGCFQPSTRPGTFPRKRGLLMPGIKRVGFD